MFVIRLKFQSFYDYFSNIYSTNHINFYYYYSFQTIQLLIYSNRTIMNVSMYCCLIFVKNCVKIAQFDIRIIFSIIKLYPFTSILVLICKRIAMELKCNYNYLQQTKWRTFIQLFIRNSYFKAQNGGR